MFELLIKNAMVVDGTGASRFTADIGIEKGIIKAVGNLQDEKAEKVLNVDGMCVAPGFIDSHSHSDWVVFMQNGGKSVLEQGITTEICGNCGGSVAPLMPQSFDPTIQLPDDVRRRLEEIGGSCAEVFSEIENTPLATNIAMFVGQGVIRGKVLDYKSKPANAYELKQMQDIVHEAMQAGALGISSGLIYPPGSFTSPEELAELVKVVAEYGGSYATHMRDESDNILECVEETLDIGRKTGCSIVVSHHKVCGKQNEGLSKKSLSKIESAIESGMRVLVDMYPYEGAGASLMASIPHQYTTDGIDELLKKLRDKQVREEIACLLKHPSKSFTNLIYECTVSGVIVSGVGSSYNGKSLEEIAKIRVEDVYETLFDLLLEYPQADAIYFANNKWDNENIMCRPYVSFGVDGLQSDIKKPNDHPRCNAAFPRILGEFCRDKKFFSLETCIHKMTGLVSDFYKFTNKGKIAVGMDADLVVFDADIIAGPADYGSADKPNVGIEYVFVNGVMAVKHGKSTGCMSGKLLRR